MKTKLVRPVLMPVDKSFLYLHGGKLYNNRTTMHIPDGKQQPQQLILISLEDEKIEVGENYYNTRLNKVFEAIANDGYPSKEDCKVIATQEQLSPELIQQLVDEYNNGGMKDFEIEMIEKIHNHYSGANAQWKELLPKLTNSFGTVVTEKENSDREIIEHVFGKCQMTYTEEDMLQAFTAGEQYCLMQETSTLKIALPFDKWIHNYKKK